MVSLDRVHDEFTDFKALIFFLIVSSGSWDFFLVFQVLDLFLTPFYKRLTQSERDIFIPTSIIPPPRET
jgi:hypothetical protein